MTRWLSFIVFLIVPALFVSYAVAEKQPHKDFAGMAFRDCNNCHQASGVALNHDSDWVRGHRVLANKPVAKCAECHDQAWCLDCHTGGGIDVKLSTRNYKRDYKPKSHRSDWLEIHPLKSLDNPQSCVRCHTNQQFCTECHSRFNPPDLQFLSHRRQFRDIQLSAVGPRHEIFQPTDCQTCHPGGIVPTHRWAGDHAVEARRNLQSCQTCHSDGDVCLKCHSARTGLRVNPHPRNWGSIKGNLKNRSGGRSCIQCHDNF